MLPRAEGERALPGRPGAGALVLSIDFELGWGNQERFAGDPAFRSSVLRAREGILRLLELLDDFDVAATWAVVGLLFGDERGEWRGERPRTGRLFDQGAPPGLDPSLVLDELARPDLVAPSLVRRIVRARRHEIATHTFSHFFWMEEGSTLEDFRRELRAARALADWWNVSLTSIVLPRNQYEPVLAPVLLEEGITAYRGNPPSRMWTFRDAMDADRPLRRVARLLDAYVFWLPQRTILWNEVLQPDGLSNVRASFFLRPYSRRLRALEGVRLARLRRCLRGAAERGEILHLWWHPHNFSRHLEENLSFLRALLETYGECRRIHGMRSLTMAQVDRIARGTPAELAPGAR